MEVQEESIGVEEEFVLHKSGLLRGPPQLGSSSFKPLSLYDQFVKIKFNLYINRTGVLKKEFKVDLIV